jgi:hypothetical protein
MELGSKVTLLEEEVAVLKGEIKTILQEVRTAVLARENPFAAGVHENLQIPTPDVEPAPLPATPEPAAQQPETLPKVIQLTSAPEPEQPDATPFSGRDETDAARPMASQPPANRRWSVASLATLIAWTQETAARMDASDMDILLSLARYGGLIDPELEATLLKLSTPLFEKDPQPRQKGVGEYLLALRELSALIEEAEDKHRGTGPLRRVS